MSSKREAICLLRPLVSERIRNTRLDVIAAVSDEQYELWLADGDAGEVFARIPASDVPALLAALKRAADVLEREPPESERLGQYPRPCAPGSQRRTLTVQWYCRCTPSKRLRRGTMCPNCCACESDK